MSDKTSYKCDECPSHCVVTMEKSTIKETPLLCLYNDWEDEDGANWEEIKVEYYDFSNPKSKLFAKKSEAQEKFEKFSESFWDNRKPYEGGAEFG